MLNFCAPTFSSLGAQVGVHVFGQRRHSELEEKGPRILGIIQQYARQGISRHRTELQGGENVLESRQDLENLGRAWRLRQREDQRVRHKSRQTPQSQELILSFSGAK